MPTLDELPLFASDEEIAVAIVGRKRAQDWLRNRLPALEGKGFPKVDDFHGGRPVPLVRLFYAGYFGIPKTGEGRPDRDEDPTAWKKSALRHPA